MVTIPPRKSLFLESVATGQHRHTSEWIATDIERVITQNNIKFAGVVTDNTSANKKAWEILAARFPSLFFQGCTSHGLHLLVKDMFPAAKSTNREIINQDFLLGIRLRIFSTFRQMLRTLSSSSTVVTASSRSYQSCRIFKIFVRWRSRRQQDADLYRNAWKQFSILNQFCM
jgi:hypothetical protein